MVYSTGNRFNWRCIDVYFFFTRYLIILKTFFLYQLNLIFLQWSLSNETVEKQVEHMMEIVKTIRSKKDEYMNNKAKCLGNSLDFSKKRKFVSNVQIRDKKYYLW